MKMNELIRLLHEAIVNHQKTFIYMGHVFQVSRLKKLI